MYHYIIALKTQLPFTVNLPHNITILFLSNKMNRTKTMYCRPLFKMVMGNL